jgi:hypothetical protein
LPTNCFRSGSKDNFADIHENLSATASVIHHAFAELGIMLHLAEALEAGDGETAELYQHPPHRGGVFALLFFWRAGSMLRFAVM